MAILSMLLPSAAGFASDLGEAGATRRYPSIQWKMP